MKQIDVHGCIKSEATIKVRVFIKECFLHSEYFCLIIHGTGKHVLQKATHEICEESKYVDHYEYAPPQLGGAGATLIYLKKRGLHGEIIDL